jgi:hypothetical protein
MEMEWEVRVSRQGLHVSTDVAKADWLKPRLRPFASAVAAVVPDGFAAYLRIPHSEPGCEGNLPADQLRILCATLAQHTATPSACYFCLWDGYGRLHGSPAVARLTQVHSDTPAARGPRPRFRWRSALQRRGVRVRLPHRDYLLFTGALDAAPDLGFTVDGIFYGQSPNLFWPDDHAWCVASEIDLMYTLVAGPQSLAAALVANPRLQAAPVTPSDALTPDGRTGNEQATRSTQ